MSKLCGKLIASKRNKCGDEFYTYYSDVEKGINVYYKYDNNVFRDKTILLPCDDLSWSSFTEYFLNNFEKFGIKKLISSCYSFDGCGKVLIVDSDSYKKYNISELKEKFIKDLIGNGDFRSDEIKKFHDEADIIVTNPPFSLFREFFDWIQFDKRKFAVVCSNLSIFYLNILAYFLLKLNNCCYINTHTTQ